MSTIVNFPAHLDEKVKESFIQYSKFAMQQSVFNLTFRVNDSNDYSRGYTTIEGGNEVAFFAESENLEDVTITEGYEAVGVSEEFGGKITITKKEKLNAKDETTLFNLVVDEKIPLIMSRMVAFIERQSVGLFNDGFVGATFLAPDGNAIFGSHTWNSTGTTFNNRSTTNVAAGQAALEELEEYAGSFLDANNVEMPLSLTTLYVKKGGVASREFRKVLAGNEKLQATTIGNVNIYNNGVYTLIETPYITSADAWFAHDTTQANSFIMDFIQRPALEERQLRENLTEVFPASASFRFGNFILPTDWFGSTGV